MKKYFYLAAVSAMMLTACSSDKDVLEPTPKPSTPTVAAQQQAVAFDTYLAGTTASTRAGDPTGVMTTDKLKTENKGFGVFAMYQDNDNYVSGNFTPNFMFNQQVKWDAGWTYSPLKYWPNETTIDSQDPAASADELDKISFFAYAPYVNLTKPGTMTIVAGDTPTTQDAYVEATPSTGILAITKEDYQNDPLVEWKVSANPDNNVDLLWGVAPAGMQYTAVNKNGINKPVGYPLLDMVKPDKDQRMKFLFQHALSRIGLSVVSAIDQIAAGDDGLKYTTDETRVLIEEVRIYGNFGLQGVLNLNNSAKNVANWIEASVDRNPSTVNVPLFTINADNGSLAPSLRYDADQINAVTGTTTPPVPGDPTKFAALNTGVLASEQNLMIGGPDPSMAIVDPDYQQGTILYKKADAPSMDYIIAKAKTTTAGNKVYSKSGSDYKEVYDGTGTGYEVDGSAEYYILSVATKNASTDAITGDMEYWTLNANGKDYDHNVHATADPVIDDGTYYILTPTALDKTNTAYADGTYYYNLLPRYFMVIPSALPAVKGTTETTINVKITYHVVTKDTKLSGNISDVSNAITKSASVQLESGKSYNLKLILGLTSVKLDATVADWQVADDSEIFLPKNNE